MVQKTKRYLQNRHFFPAFPFHFAVGEIPLSIKICLVLNREILSTQLLSNIPKNFNAHIMIYIKLYAWPLKPVIWIRSLYESYVEKISIVIIVIIILYSYFYFILFRRRLQGISSVTFTQSKAISLSTYFITLRTCSIYMLPVYSFPSNPVSSTRNGL